MKYIILTILYSCITLNIQAQTCEYFIHYDFEYIIDTMKQSISAPEKYVLYRVGDDTRFLSGAQYYNDSVDVKNQIIGVKNLTILLIEIINLRCVQILYMMLIPKIL